MNQFARTHTFFRVFRAHLEYFVNILVAPFLMIHFKTSMYVKNEQTHNVAEKVVKIYQNALSIKISYASLQIG